MDNLLAKALRDFNSGPLNQLLTNLSGPESDRWALEFAKFLRKETCWTGEGLGNGNSAPPTNGGTTLPFPVLSDLLAPVDTVAIPASPTSFLAKDAFVLASAPHARAKIHFLSDNLKRWFLSHEGKIEPPFHGTVLQRFTLLKDSLDEPIIAALGGKLRAETSLYEIHTLLLRQRNGEQGPLATNGFANIFYVRDSAGVLRSVNIDWNDKGWQVFVDQLPHQDLWLTGRQVFARANHA